MADKKKGKAKVTSLESVYVDVCKLSKTKRKALAARLMPEDLKELLTTVPWPIDTRKELGLTTRHIAYIQDPLVARENRGLGMQWFDIDWEPELGDGPTSARVAVVDYDADTNRLEPAARWDPCKWAFVGPDGQPFDEDNHQDFQFHQVNAWATVMKIIDFFEDPGASGRPIPWAFEGNRLIVVPHAGYGENAFYDRRSKSLQFYYCGTKEDPVYTCLSHDIIAHETGHALLDGIRPLYNECSSLETAAFHEFIANLTAILAAFRNNDFRHKIAKVTKGDLAKANTLADLGREFAQYVAGRDYIYTALNQETMDILENGRSPHDCSQVLTGAMFDIMTRMASRFLKIDKKSVCQSFWYTIDRFIRVALQPLDYCPPVDIQFSDYAEAVLRRDQLNNPRDPRGFRPIMRKVFKERKIQRPGDEKELTYGDFYCPNIDHIAASRTAAYRFLHERREDLCIPWHQDFVVTDLYVTNKVRRARRRLPREIVLQYVWREDIELKGSRFGPLRGERIPLLCGGTLVYDENGNLLYRCHKPGTQFETRKIHPRAKKLGEKLAEKDRRVGERRRRRLLKYTADCIEKGLATLPDENEPEGLSALMPVVGRREDGTLRLEVTPPFRHWGMGIVKSPGEKSEKDKEEGDGRQTLDTNV